jgi:1-acyl-sn-glycerol-3-phosphate acyltransferase
LKTIYTAIIGIIIMSDEMEDSLVESSDSTYFPPGRQDEETLKVLKTFRVLPASDALNFQDDWGLDPRFFEAVISVLQIMYKRYWRVEVTGLENLPEHGRALLVSNHSGQFPFDAMMIGTAVYNHTPQHRLVRNLYGTWFARLPFAALMLTRLGQVLATEQNVIRLLKQGEIVAVFPEGYKGIGKLYRQRYQLARFGRGGFVRVAIRARAPIIPVAVVGAEETYIALAHFAAAEKLFGYPMPPITPTWPWLGPLGAIPLPTKWSIEFGAPIETSDLAPEAAENQAFISQLSDQVRNTIQTMLYQRLFQRRSIFFG